MNYLDLFKITSAARETARNIHQLALSNQLSDDDSNLEFEKFDKKLFSFEKAIVELFGLRAGDYVYVKPALVNPNCLVTNDLVYSKLITHKNSLQKLQDDLKLSNYKLVDKQKNECRNLNNGARSVLTKSITAISKLADKYGPEEEVVEE